MLATKYPKQKFVQQKLSWDPLKLTVYFPKSFIQIQAKKSKNKK